MCDEKVDVWIHYGVDVLYVDEAGSILLVVKKPYLSGEPLT